MCEESKPLRKPPPPLQISLCPSFVLLHFVSDLFHSFLSVHSLFHFRLFFLFFFIVLSLSSICSSCMPCSLILSFFACPFSSSNIFFFSNFSSFIHSFFCHSLSLCHFVLVFIGSFFSHSFLNPFQGQILSLFKVFSFNIPPFLNYLSFPETFRFLVSFLHSFSHFISSLSFSHLRSFIIMSCSFICIFCSFSFVYFVGVSPTKDFHSRIGIFESCRYFTDSRIICLGAWSKYITKSQVRQS